jgi:Bacterial Ig-like domain (group 2)
MKGKWVVAGLVVVAGVMLSVSSCGRSQELVSIQIQPAVENFGSTKTPLNMDAGLQVQLRALGTFIHPPVTKDITSQVTWSSNTPQMVTVDANGVITATGNACGGTLISATVKTNSTSSGLSASGAIITGYMTANVICFTGNASEPALTVTFSGNGAGTVTSSPSGLSCASPTACVAQFATGTPLSLTAAATGTSSFGSWSNCDSSSNVNPCTIALNANRTVTVTFN